MNGQRYRETPLDIERLRRLNRATVERYMAMKGAERLQRHSLFVEDGCAGNWTTESGEPLVFQGYCENHYIHSFELENGRIKRNREFMNPIQKLRALGIAVPQIKRDGIPT
ncbi:PhzA/PhzB family protein [Pseudomonas aeruginosa]|uniref:PhzA/PhzB family protein n=1 Tax=Pseudomonas aeruginosa TaxID=287 RepID=UPI001908C4C4|nr:PhzA/PhzB family protein [Pseudomonas aeruginosa]MBK1802098.1 PhzA/PhzB family protein [Pseudomonas aeruginosa]